eukprot:775727_1
MLAFIIYMLFPYSAHSQNVCLWGRTGSNSFLNGEYIYQGDINGGPWYRKDVDFSSSISTTYLWRYNTKYYFTDDPPGTLSSYQYLAKCMISTSNPFDCNLNWRIASETTNDINLYSQYAPCPQWDCDEIISSQSYALCNGPFDIHIGSNVWRNTANTRYWYFHPIYFMWVCASTYSLGSDGIYWAYTERKWIELSNNSSIVNLNFQTPMAESHQIECVKSTVNPTSQPTQIPTNIPTISPTHMPTIIPSIYPTISPTNNPTTMPSIYPTEIEATAHSETELISIQMMETTLSSLTYISNSN